MWLSSRNKAATQEKAAVWLLLADEPSLGCKVWPVRSLLDCVSSEDVDSRQDLSWAVSVCYHYMIKSQQGSDIVLQKKNTCSEQNANQYANKSSACGHHGTKAFPLEGAGLGEPGCLSHRMCTIETMTSTTTIVGKIRKMSDPYRYGLSGPG